jgi:hypothetical protein
METKSPATFSEGDVGAQTISGSPASPTARNVETRSDALLPRTEFPASPANGPKVSEQVVEGNADADEQLERDIASVRRIRECVDGVRAALASADEQIQGVATACAEAEVRLWHG